MSRKNFQARFTHEIKIPQLYLWDCNIGAPMGIGGLASPARNLSVYTAALIAPKAYADGDPVEPGYHRDSLKKVKIINR